jgi:integrase/recombinase XerC
MVNFDPPRWADALTEYTNHLRAGGRAPGTVRLHRHYLRHVATYARDPYAATVVQLTRALSVNHWQPETRKSARGVISAFYRWAYLSGHVAADPSLLLPAVSVPPGQPRPAPEAVLERALALADDRERRMLLLAAFAGLRCSEIARVNTADLVGSTLYVTGKGGKTRTVPILRDELLHDIRRADGWLFPGRVEGHLGAGTVTSLLSDVLPDGWTGHTLRHRFASRAYAGTRDLLAVGALLGHSRPETTKRYVLMPDDALRAAVAAAA